MPAQWRIEYWPGCVAHAFLSHCAEDRDGLVLPVFEELSASHRPVDGSRALSPRARGNRGVAGGTAQMPARDLLHHTGNALPRTRMAGRRTGMAATIQQHLRDGQEIAHVEMALLFVKTTDPAFQRSVWRSLVDKAECCPHPVTLPAASSDAGRRDWHEHPVFWAAERVEQFVRQEERWAKELEVRFGEDPSLGRSTRHEPYLVRRLLAQDRPPLPIAQPSRSFVAGAAQRRNHNHGLSLRQTDHQGPGGRRRRAGAGRRPRPCADRAAAPAGGHAHRKATASSARFWTASAPIAAQLDQIVESELGHFAKVSGGAPPQLEPGADPRARGRPARGRRHEGRVRLHRTPPAGPDQGRLARPPTS